MVTIVLTLQAITQMRLITLYPQRMGLSYCIVQKGKGSYRAFSAYGLLEYFHYVNIGAEGGQLLPGLYEYRGYYGDNRLPRKCLLYVNYDESTSGN